MEKDSLKTIKDLENFNFYIPNYQRGYRWDKIEVNALLQDILDFYQTDKNQESFYCLQPIVVKKDSKKYKVIDGQQRLTTIFLIIKFLDNKDIFNINKNQLSYGRGYAYSLQYHLVWCTKYRKKVLKNGIDTECKEMLQNLAEEYKFQILAMEVMPDHIHLLVDCRPQFYISDMIKIMKGNIARQMFLAHPELKKELWGGHLWNPSYCAVTVSDRSREQVCSYIEGQKEKQ